MIRLLSGRPRNHDLIPERGDRIFFLHKVETGSWAYTSSYSMGTWDLSPVLMPIGREAGQSP